MGEVIMSMHMHPFYFRHLLHKTGCSTKLWCGIWMVDWLVRV